VTTEPRTWRVSGELGTGTLVLLGAMFLGLAGDRGGTPGAGRGPGHQARPPPRDGL